ncbi:MAG: ribosomal protein L7/L12 [Ideonella sp.]
MPNPLPDDVRAALAAGQKLEAIRLLRQHTGLGLAHAKAAVESAPVPAATSPVEYGWELPSEAKAALDQGKVLQAIRLLRASKGIGLKDAKSIIDAARGTPAPRPGGRNPSGLAPGEVPRSGFGLGVVIIVLLVVAAGLWLMRRG